MNKKIILFGAIIITLVFLSLSKFQNKKTKSSDNVIVEKMIENPNKMDNSKENESLESLPEIPQEVAESVAVAKKEFLDSVPEEMRKEIKEEDEIEKKMDVQLREKLVRDKRQSANEVVITKETPREVKINKIEDAPKFNQKDIPPMPGQIVNGVAPSAIVSPTSTKSVAPPTRN